VKRAVYGVSPWVCDAVQAGTTPKCGGNMIRKFALVATIVALVGAPSWAADKENSAVKPSKKDENRHNGFLDIAKKGDIDVVFYGDSITDGWNGAGKAVWKDKFAPLKAVDFGIGGDRTQHLIWRMQNGELDGYKAKAMVLMIGTNNLGSNTNEEIADGIKAVVEEFQKKQPQAKVLLLGIFPRGEKATDKNRDRIKDINKIIAKMDDVNSWNRTARSRRRSCPTSCTCRRRVTASGATLSSPC
jgi:lysophospholipase L1-like esterase